MSLKDTNTTADKNHAKELVVSTDPAKTCEAKIKDLVDFYAQKDAFLAEIKDMGNSTLYDAKLHADFDGEELNQDWSVATEKSISMQLERNDAARNIIPSSIRCRSSSCELKIPVANTEARNKAMEILSNPDFAHSVGFERYLSLIHI